MRYCEFCGSNEVNTKSSDGISNVLLDDNMETSLCDPDCIQAARTAMKVEVLD